VGIVVIKTTGIETILNEVRRQADWDDWNRQAA
jgi:hypothetical protein